MSIRVMSAVFECETMAPFQKLVALALADHCHDDGTEARPGMARLKRKTGLSESTVHRALRSLLHDGYLEIQRKSTSTSPYVYRFTMGVVTQTGGVTQTLGGSHTDARGVSSRHPNHKEPSLNQEQPSISVPMPPNFKDVFKPSLAPEAHPDDPTLV